MEEEDDENELLDHFAQLPKVLDQMEAKVHNHENIGNLKTWKNGIHYCKIDTKSLIDEEKRILNEMLVYMNDIKVMAVDI